MESTTTPDAAHGIALNPEMNPEKIYAFVGMFGYKEAFDGVRAEREFRWRWKGGRRRLVKDGPGWLALSVEDGEPEGFHRYVAKAADGREMVKVTVSKAYFGMVVAERVEAEPGCETAVAAVFREAAKDALKMGARLLPAPPGRMGDAELKAWWEIDRILVAYYPECARLGLTLEGEEAEDLEHLRHLISALALKAVREAMVKEKGAKAVAFIEEVGGLLTEAVKAGCKRPGQMASWLNGRGVKARTLRGWSENTVRGVARHYEKLTGVRLLNPHGVRHRG